MLGNFQKAYDKIRVYEGGNDDDPQDPGGRTSRGIIQRVYDGYRRGKGLQTRDVWLASEAEVKEIYKAQYWDAIRGDELPAGIDLFVYDGAVNSGPSQSIKWLQRAIGTKDDGNIGAATLSAARMANNHDSIIANMADQRERFLRSLKHFSRYGKGWMRRVNNCEKISQSWASGTVGPQVASVGDTGGNMRANSEDADSPTISPETGMATTSATSGASVILDTVQNTTSMLQGFDGIKYVKYALIALAIIAFGVTIYSIWRSARIKEATA